MNLSETVTEASQLAVMHHLPARALRVSSQNRWKQDYSVRWKMIFSPPVVLQDIDSCILKGRKQKIESIIYSSFHDNVLNHR